MESKRKPILDETTQPPANSVTDSKKSDLAELFKRGQTFYEQGEWKPALACLEEVLRLCRETPQPDRQLEAFTLNLLGGLYYYRAGRQSVAGDYYRQALEISRESGDKPGEARALFNLAGIYQAEARYPEAKELLDRLVALDRELESQDLRSHLIVLGAVRKRLKRLGLANSHHDPAESDE